MRSPISVSALIVTYNHGRYVAEAIRSALAQSRPPDEILIVDDGSDDDTVEQARAVGAESLRVIALAHRGIASLAETYNSGLEAARGELIAILEGDDRWPAGKLERQLRAFEDQEIAVSHGMYAVIGAQGAVLKPAVAPPLRLPIGRYDARPYLLRSSYIMAVTAVIRRRTLLEVRGFSQLPGTPHWDYPTFLRLAEVGPFHNDTTPLGEWRRQRASVTHRLAGRDLVGAELALRLALESRSRAAGDSFPSPARIRRAWHDAYGRMAWQNGRILLVNGRYAEARDLLLRAMRRPASVGVRARLLVATAAALLHVPLEPLVSALTGRSALEELD